MLKILAPHSLLGDHGCMIPKKISQILLAILVMSIMTISFTGFVFAQSACDGLAPQRAQECRQDIANAVEQKSCDNLAPQYAQECQKGIDDAAAAAQKAATDARTNEGITSTATGSTTTGSDKLDQWLQDIINLLSGLVALVCVISLIFAGFQYMTAGGNAGQVAAAKNRIVMVVLAFVVFAFGYGILQWLIPGGIFN